MAANKPAPTPKECACNCGEYVNPKSMFRQGHDQRLVGNLARWTAEGTIDVGTRTRLGLPDDVNNVVFIDRIAGVSDAISRRFTPQLANKYYAAAERVWGAKASKPRTASMSVDVLPVRPPDSGDETVEEIQRMLDNPPTVAEQVASQIKNGRIEARLEALPGSVVRAKIGRWIYDATVIGMNQSGKVTMIKYVPRNGGDPKTTGKFEIVPT